MNISRKTRSFIVCAYLAPAVFGLGGFAVPAGAQNAVSSAATMLTDGEVAMRVRGALHAAPYLYDEHVAVSVEDGAVVLRGIVFSDSDLVDAIRIASKAAGERRVVDDLSIERNGRR
jgi:osmotically-inducible protein OsmY